MYDCEEEDDLIYAWREMLQKYDFEDNGWLKVLYEIREKEVLAYVSFVNMISTQRSVEMAL